MQVDVIREMLVRQRPSAEQDGDHGVPLPMAAAGTWAPAVAESPAQRPMTFELLERVQAASHYRT